MPAGDELASDCRELVSQRTELFLWGEGDSSRAAKEDLADFGGDGGDVRIVFEALLLATVRGEDRGVDVALLGDGIVCDSAQHLVCEKRHSKKITLKTAWLARRSRARACMQLIGLVSSLTPRQIEIESCTLNLQRGRMHVLAGPPGISCKVHS